MAERTSPGLKVALTIAGSDSSGGAGIQADLKTFTVMDVYGASVITAITAQNTTGVQQVQLLEPALIERQIESVAGDLLVSATKTGMLGSAAIVAAVADAIERRKLAPLVVDPVMLAKSGDSLIDDAAVTVLCRKLLPLATVVTPNRLEAERLLDRPGSVPDQRAAGMAAREICRRFGARACVITGFKQPDEHEGEAVDVFFDGRELHEVVAPWRDTSHTHGAGCTFSAALAAALAKGQTLPEAVQTAKSLISEAIRQANAIGQGISPVNHLAYLKVKA